MRPWSFGILAATYFLASCGDSGGGGNSVTPPPPPPPYAPWASAIGTDAYGTWAELTVTGNGETAIQRFRLVSPGTFEMGSNAGEAGRDTDETAHQVTITIPYWIADSECSQRMWKAVMNANPSYNVASGLDSPVDTVSYITAQGFLTALQALKPNLLPRLPTDAEWEYAARAGTVTPFSISPVSPTTIACMANFTDPYVIGVTGPLTIVVTKSLPANGWGLYEVHGNLWEWCSDYYQADLGNAPATNPQGPASSAFRVLRSGGYGNTGESCRSANRIWEVPGNAANTVGFRLATTAQPSGGG